MVTSPRVLVPLALAATYLIWGSTYYGMAVAIRTLPPLRMGGIRYTIAGALLMLILRWRGAALPTVKQWKSAAIFGGLLLLIGNGAVGIALQYINSSTTALTIATTPAWAAIIAIFFTGARPRRLEWAGIALGIIGVALLHYKNPLPLHPLGLTLLLIATVSWAWGSIWSRYLDQASGLMASSAQMLAGGLMLLVASLVMRETGAEPASPRSLTALAYLIVFGSMIAFSAYGYLVKTVQPALATSNALVNPLVAVVIGAGLGGEPLSPMVFAAMFVILAGVGLVALAKGR